MFEGFKLALSPEQPKSLRRFACISYNMGTSALPDMYARSPRAEGMHIRQSVSAHVITNMLHFWHSSQTLIELAHSTYILKDAHCDCGILL